MRGSVTIDLTTETRSFSPRDKSSHLVSEVAIIPTSAKSFRGLRCCVRPSPMTSTAYPRRRPGSLGMYARCSRSWSSSISKSGTFPIVITPSLRFSSEAIARSNVDFPTPEGPVMAILCPAGICNEAPRRSVLPLSCSEMFCSSISYESGKSTSPSYKSFSRLSKRSAAPLMATATSTACRTPVSPS